MTKPRPVMALAVLSVLVAAGCSFGSSSSGSGSSRSGRTESGSGRPAALSTVPSTPAVPTTTPTSPGTSSTPARTSTTASGPSSSPRTSSHSTQPASPPPVSTSTHPVIVIDPGHSVTVHGTDPGTGLDVSDYENEPEMRDVFAVAELVRAKLEAAGYRVIMTKTSVDAPTNLGKRADIANAAHAALALSIHDQAGSNGGLPFATSNNTVYYQAVGDYRVNPKGTKVVFNDAALAAVSKRYGQIFQSERSAVEGHSVRLQSNTGYDLGSRGLQAGNIWIVQLLSHVPWIYNEAGGNSPGRSGLDSADMQRYANGLVASVEHCVPIH